MKHIEKGVYSKTTSKLMHEYGVSSFMVYTRLKALCSLSLNKYSLKDVFWRRFSASTLGYPGFVRFKALPRIAHRENLLYTGTGSGP